MLHVLDITLLILHTAVIGFNLTGWIWRSTRRWHLLSVGITAASWIFGGFFYQFGYCFLTDWQWQIKHQLGETDLPASFIKYGLDTLFFRSFNASTVDLVTATVFGTAVVLSLVVNRKLLRL